MRNINSQTQNTVSQPSTIGSLQAYITELTLYINENNEKYTRNLQTLKQFYESQIHQQNQKIVQFEEQLLHSKNQNITLKDILQNKNMEIEELKSKINQLKNQVKEMNVYIKEEKDKRQEVYKQMDNFRVQMQTAIDQEIQKNKKIDADRSELLIRLKQKQAQIRMNQKNIQSLQQKVAERYSLPQQIKQIQIQSAKDKTKIAGLQQKIVQLTKERDFSQTQLERKRKQNEKLVIQANKSKGDLSFQIEKAIRKEKQRLNQQLQNLKLQNQRKIFQIKDLQIKLRQQIQSCRKLQASFEQTNQSAKRMKIQIKQLQQDKAIYLQQFRKLKSQYEQVINNLQIAIPEYQKKNWTLEQENQQLNAQLDSLQQLLRQVRAMNDLQPLRKQYRQWSQLNLAVDKKLPQQKQKIIERKQINSIISKQKQDELSPQWERLMQDLQKIQI